MQSKQDISEQACKRQRVTAKKKTVSFSSNAKLRTVFNDENQQTYFPWLTDDEVSSMKKRARKLSKLHYIKTRPGQPKAPSDRSGIVYNCHPALYEIIGESLRGMEHLTCTSKARSRERLRSGAISFVEDYQNQDNTTRVKLVCKYIESTKEAMAYSIQMAEEDARAAAAILTEDLKQYDDVASPPSSISSKSSTVLLSCGITNDFPPELSRILSSSTAQYVSE